MKKLTLKDFQDRLKLIHPKEKLQAIEWNGRRQPVKVKCLTCNTIYLKNGECFLDKRKTSICKKCFPTYPNQLKDTFLLPQEYSYIEEYKGMHNKVLIRHEKCGFIWKITPANIKLGKGCPKCNKKASKGEQKIIKWLEENRILYERQIPLDIEGHHLFIDFYLPSFDIYIEYNGEQHYKMINFFGGKTKFLRQQKNDALKREFLKNKLVEIPYTFFKNIEKILESSTTIPNGSMRQVMAVEVENLLQEENDIVSTSSEN